MKILHLSIIGVAIAGFLAIPVFIYYQNLSFQQELSSYKENSKLLNSTLNNYVDFFGKISNNYTSTPFSLHLKVYVADPVDTNPVDTVKVNQQYQVVAQVTRQGNQPLIYYYCIVQVQDDKGIDIADGWSQQTMIPKQSLSECATRWIPNSIGNYTISAFAWQDLHGTPRAEPATENVQVLSSLDNNKISATYANGTYTGFPISYTITGDNKLLDASLDSKTKTLELSLQAPSNGTLTVTVPRVLLDAKTLNGQDDMFILLIDGRETKYTQITSALDRTLTIPFEQGAMKIKIIATQII